MHPSAQSGGPPANAAEAVVQLLMQAGRKLRVRHPADAVDPSSFPLVRALMCADGLRLSDLATSIELDASTVSRQIKQLEDKQIVERTPDPADGRASLIRLTEQGRAEMQATFTRRFERIQNAMSDWSDDDRDHLKILLTRLADDLRLASDNDDSRSIS